jgi:hypothetical protein
MITISKSEKAFILRLSRRFERRADRARENKNFDKSSEYGVYADDLKRIYKSVST